MSFQLIIKKCFNTVEIYVKSAIVLFKTLLKRLHACHILMCLYGDVRSVIASLEVSLVSDLWWSMVMNTVLH